MTSEIKSRTQFLSIIGIVFVFLLSCNTSLLDCKEVQFTPQFGVDENNRFPQFNCIKTQYYDRDFSNYIARESLDFARNIGSYLDPVDSRTFSNIIISPVSLLSAVVTLMMGAAGRTYAQFLHLLRLTNEDQVIAFHKEFSMMIDDLTQSTTFRAKERHCSSPNWRSQTKFRDGYGKLNQNVHLKVNNSYLIRIANGIFIPNGYEMNPNYRNALVHVYGARIDQLDFHNRPYLARDYINNWVHVNTFGRISSVIASKELKSLRMLVANVFYFKGLWETSFFPHVHEHNFYPDGRNGPSVTVNMMATGGLFPFYESIDYGCRIIGLPYRGNETTLYLIQPHESTQQKLKNLQQFLDATAIDDMIDRMTQKSAIVIMPKMHFSKTFFMKEVLQKMGLTDVMSPVDSNLSLIGQSPPTIYPPNKQEPHWHEVSALHRANYDAYTPQASRIYPITKEHREYRRKRQLPPRSSILSESEKEQIKLIYLQRLAEQRYNTTAFSDLFVDDILHKLDFIIDEHGTEVAAATLTILPRTGTDVIFRADTPFLLLLRHDTTHFPLLYGPVYVPEF